MSRTQGYFKFLFYICDNNDNKDDDINNKYTINNKVFLDFTNGVTK